MEINRKRERKREKKVGRKRDVRNRLRLVGDSQLLHYRGLKTLVGTNDYDWLDFVLSIVHMSAKTIPPSRNASFKGFPIRESTLLPYMFCVPPSCSICI